MTKKIDLKSDILDDSDAGDIAFYEFFGMSYFLPSQVQDVLNSAAPNEDIELDINSNGGDTSAASTIYSMLKAYQGQINIFIQGMAASAASIIAMAGDHVAMAPTAQMMIHKCLADPGGYVNADGLRQLAAQNDSVDIGIANAYMAKTGMSQSDLLQLMSNQTFMDAKTAVDKGFADEVAFSGQKTGIADKAPVFSNSVSKMPSREVVDKFNSLLGKAKAFDKLETIKPVEDPPKTTDKENNKKTDKSELKRELALLF
ncbi:head maturation protease, ClpP-related [Oenococcus oeni]|uniref:head maturation protease, ClpP-related n=1 Tax=Oenococcus oeni TaxID=1247 RepID=UPI0010B44CFE|nr:head maturation protease, ClpP-related [Oenococcus oeni]SYW16205.1 ATP-dependent Clp protease proteolytic subunit [Oenococcus oeni]